MTQWFCVRCGAEIPAERILALHNTRICVKCSEAIGGEFQRIVTMKGTSKAGSLKITGCEVSMRLKRKHIEPLESNRMN